MVDESTDKSRINETPGTADGTPCNDFCDREECAPEEGSHVMAPFVVTDGGPMADKNSRAGTLDTTMTVGVNQCDAWAQIVLRLRIFLCQPGGDWFAPTEVNDMLPGIGMNSARARHTARLLNQAADTYDQIVGARQKTISVARRHLTELVRTIGREQELGWRIGNNVGVALAAYMTLDIPADPDMHVTVPINVACWLYLGSKATDAYGLDPDAEETFNHPAVLAEMAMFHVIADTPTLTKIIHDVHSNDIVTAQPPHPADGDR